MVLSTALFEKPAFRNLICNGIVPAKDRKRTNKLLKNRPSPMEIISEYGAVSCEMPTLSLKYLCFERVEILLKLATVDVVYIIMMECYE